MSDSHTPTPPPPPDPDGELLSAYLDGELDPGQEAALEARLAAEPELAALLERTTEVLLALRGLDEAVPPVGYSERLHARLSAERDAVPIDLAAVRARRRPSWPLVGGIAAAAVAAAIMGAGVLSGFGRSAGDQVALQQRTSGEQAYDSDALRQSQDGALDDFRGGSRGGSQDELTMEAAPQQEGASAEAPEPGSETFDEAQLRGDAAGGSAGSGDAAADGETQMAPSQSQAADYPVLLDEQVPLADEAAAQARYEDLPEARHLMGMPVDEAREAGPRSRAAVRSAERFASGPHPADCLGHVAPEAESLVVARVETVRYQDRDALAYVLAGATSDSATLDRIEVWITGLPDCGTRLFLTFSG